MISVCRQTPESGDEAAAAETVSNMSRRPFENCTLLMLSRISHMDQPVKELADPDTIDTLIRYSATMDKPLPRASRILHRLTRYDVNKFFGCFVNPKIYIFHFWCSTTRRQAECSVF